VKLVEVKVDMNQRSTPRSMFPNVKRVEVLGTGTQTIAYAHKKFPNHIMKFIAIGEKNSGALAFARVCITHKDNPYFPKVVAHKVVPRADFTESELMFIYQNEMDQARKSTHYLMLVVERLTEAPNYDTINKYLKNIGIDLHEYVDYDAATIQDAFNNYFIRKDMFARCTDVNFKKALRVLEPLFLNHYIDMHEGNIMFRGNQLVINDPVL
jgi:hypothetical protein